MSQQVMPPSPATATRPSRHPAWLAVPLIACAVVALSLGLLVRAFSASPDLAPTFHFVFSDVIHFKVWLATAALALGVGQVVTAARIFGVVRFPPGTTLFQVIHRSSGWLAIGLTLPVAYYCLFLLGVNPIDARIVAHAALGCFFYGVFVGKLVLVNGKRYPGWALPIAGSLLFTVLLGLWLTSALWFLSIHGVAR